MIGDLLDALPDSLKAVGSFALAHLMVGGKLLIAAASVLLGSPEIVVALVSSMHRVAGLVPFIPQSLLKQLLTVGLVAMAVIYALRIVDKVFGRLKSES